MGICSSTIPFDYEDGVTIGQRPSPMLSRIAKQQRRRLSVDPEHVGDFTQSHIAQMEKDEIFNLTSGITHQLLPTGGYWTTKRAYPIPTTDAEVRHVAVTKKGYVPYNREKRNQDTYIVIDHLRGYEDFSVFGVCDGHGEFGHLVSGFVRDHLPTHLSNQRYLASDPANSIKLAVKNMADQLEHSDINCAYSGTTLVLAIKMGRNLVLANVGDSRAVCARTTPNSYAAMELTYDHKPENPYEKERILMAGGRVEPLSGPPGEDCGPSRVWLKDIDVPGLAMSRSLGDDVSHTVGVISEPEITTFQLTEHDAYFCLASDGVFEFMENQDVCDVIWKFRKNVKQAAAKLCAKSVTRWRKLEEVIDDITAVIVKVELPPLPPPPPPINYAMLPRVPISPTRKCEEVVDDITAVIVKVDEAPELARTLSCD